MISVVVPVYHESAILRANVMRLKKAMDALKQNYEILVMVDGSTDGSREIAEKLASNRVRVLNSETRLGRGASLRNAMAAAKGDLVMYTDADLAVDLAYLGPLLHEVEEGADISTGSRLMSASEVRGRSLLREFFSRSYNRMLRLLFRTSIKDHQCGFKAFRKSSVLPILDEVKARHWFWDSELLIRAQDNGLRVAEIPVKWTDSSKSTVDLRRDVACMGAAALELRFRI